MNLKEFAELDQWNDSHVGYSIQCYDPRARGTKKLYSAVSQITLERAGEGPYAVVLHVAENTVIRSANPCPSDLLLIYETTTDPEKTILLFEKNGKLYDFKKAELLDKSADLWINEIDQKIAFDLGPEYEPVKSFYPEKDTSLGSFTVDVVLQTNGKYDIWTAHEGSSGCHYTDVTADRIGEYIADEIEAVAENYMGGEHDQNK